MNKCIGIPGIPPILDSLMDGAIYSAFVESAPARFSIIIQALKGNIARGFTAVLLTPTPPGVFLARAQSAGVDFSEDLLQERLFLFSPEGDYAKNIFRLGAKRFMEDFSFFPIPEGSFYLFDQASDLFTLHDQAVSHQQAESYRDWMKGKGNSALFLFPVPEGEKEERQYLGLQDFFTGEFRVVQQKGSLELLVDFWYAQEGTVAAKFIPVVFDAAGLLLAEGHVAPTPEKAAFDLNQAFYYGPDFEAFASALFEKVSWNKAESLVSLMHLTRSSVAAAIVLSVDRHSDLRQIAETVHYLRLNLGKQARIIVRESNFFLRSPYELLMLRLGANLVIHANTAPNRLPLLWDSLAGQAFEREVEPDFEDAYNSIAPSEFTGYVEPALFAEEVRLVLDRLDHLAIPPALVAATCRQDAGDTLKKFVISRRGDLLTAADKRCYLFLHSCPEDHVAAAFSRIVDGEPDALFSDIGFVTSPQEIRMLLAKIPSSAAHQPVPEPAPSPAPAPAPARAPVEETDRFYFGPGMNSLASQLPGKSSWKAAGSIAELLKLASNRKNPLIVIAVDAKSDLRLCAETVHGLRKTLGNDAKIVVREHDFSLRRPYAAMLLRLGANLILHRQMSQAEIRIAWDSMTDFSGEPVEDFEHALASIAPSKHTGYVELTVFCKEVLSVVERADEAVIPPALVVAGYKKPVHPPEILSRIKIWRQGDLLSSDRDNCYLFLHSCPEADLALAFSRIIEEKPENLFSGIGYISEKEKIRDLVARLAGAKKSAIIPDYGRALREIELGQKPGVDNVLGRRADHGAARR